MDPTKQGRLLIVDDAVVLQHHLCKFLAQHGYDTAGHTRAAEALHALKQEPFDVLLSDLVMPEMDGLALLRAAREHDPNLIVIMITGHASVATAVEAMKAGAFDYVVKPFEPRLILAVVERALEVRRLRQENHRLRQAVAHLHYESPRYTLVGASPALRRAVQLIEKVAPTTATVLVRGPSGTGKELVARALHHNSPRRTGPLVIINCAALQETLLETELFGHEKGAFSGAVQAKAGLIEVADGGTLFIDEVAEMTPALQAKLLRVLEDGSYRRVGGTRERRADVRIIAATNKPLEAEQEAGRFRADLFYRLNVVSVELPPLRERREDVPALVEHFLTTRALGGAPCRIDPPAREALCQYDWPGNVRELANVLERAQILADADCITLADLPETLHAHRRHQRPAEFESLELSVMERRLVWWALHEAHGNLFVAAKCLGISRRSLYRLVRKHDLESELHKARA